MRYGIIGAGLMGVEHIHNLNALPGARVVAVSDPDPGSRERGRDAAAQPVSVFGDHRDLLAHAGCDAVVIASPNHTHVDVVADAIDAGVAVLVEKPLCTTVADCQRVVALARSATAPVQVGLEYRWMPPVARLVHEVRAGAVGTVRMVAVREHRFPFLPKVGDWNRFSVNTGGTLVEKCCHFFDLMHLIVGERPVRAMASGAQDVNHLDERYDGRVPDILDNAFVIVDFPSGARASLDLCMFAEATHDQEELSVVGEFGKVEARIPSNVVHIGRRGEHAIGRVDTVEVTDPSIAYEGYHHGASYLEHVHFLAAVRGEAPVAVTVDDGLWSVAVGVAAQRSIAEGRPVTLDEVLYG